MLNSFTLILQLASTEAESSQRTLLILYIIGCLIGCALGLYFRHTNASIRRVIRTTPFSPIRNAKVGFQKVSGTLRAVKGPLKSPLKNEKCVYYQLTVSRLNDSGGENPTTQREVIYEDIESSYVYLEGGAGKLSIDIFGIECLDEKTFSKVLKVLKKKDRKYAKVLEKKLGISLSFSLGYYEVRETFFPANQKCFAYGSVIKKEIPKSKEDSSGLEISAESDERLVMTDGPHGSLLTTKTEEVYLDWLNAVIFKSTLFLMFP